MHQGIIVWTLCETESVNKIFEIKTAYKPEKRHISHYP